MERVLFNENVYELYDYENEAEFEQIIKNNIHYIFGNKALYLDIKKRIGDNIVTIPDAYLIDFTFETSPRLYIIENELSSHDPYKHIGSQILKFAISYKQSARKIKDFLLENIMGDKDKLDVVELGLKKADYRNIDAFIEGLIFDKPIAAIIIIDRSSNELENVLSQLTMESDIIEFQRYKCGNEFIYKYIPFNEEIIQSIDKNKILNIEDFDTIVVPAQADGFQSAFIDQNAWWAIRISASMLERIKYIAAYQVAPISAITHIAEVSKIEKYKDTNKYILYFKNPAKEINHIKLNPNSRGLQPQAPRYTSYKKILNAKMLSDIF